MRVRLYTDLRCSPSDAPGIRDFLANRLIGREQLALHPLSIAPRGETNEASVMYDGYLLLTQAAVDLLAEIQDRWTQGPQANRIRSGSIVRWHECRHDEGAPNCEAAVGTEAIKP